MPLDKIQIAALRLAEVISFHTNKTHASTSWDQSSASYVCCTKRNEPNAAAPFAPSESVVHVPCDAILRDYDAGHCAVATPYKAFGMEHTPQSSEHWRTFVSLLHVGDEITLQWEKGGLVTEFLKERSITGDTLDIVITRNGKKLTFRIDCYVGDSRHRMVTTQRAEYAIA